MAKVLLVNPPVYDFAAYDLWARPLGLLYIAAFLESLGHSVRIVDALDRFHPSVASVTGKHAPRARHFGTGSYYWREADKPAVYGDIPRLYKRFGMPEAAFEHELRSGPSPDVVGVTSGMTYWYLGVAEAVETVRRVFPGVPIALGGIYATLCAEHAREAIRPDFLVRGEGEDEFARIVAKVCGGRSPGPGEQTPFPDLPRPAYHLLAHVPAAAVLTGRGCPFHCAYCASDILNPRVERRRPEAVADELELYAKRAVEDVAFYDDALLWEADAHVKPLLREVIGRRLALRFHTPNGLSARMLDAQTARLMKEAGFATIRISLETVAPERQADWDDKVRYDEFLRAVAYLKEAGFAPEELGAYVMAGLPGETFEEAARNVAAVHAAGVPVRLAQYSPIPGTAYFERARASAPVDITEPLLQNNTAVPLLDRESYRAHDRLKALAQHLNDNLAAGRMLIGSDRIADARALRDLAEGAGA